MAAITTRARWGARAPRSRTHMFRSDGLSLHWPGTRLAAPVARGDHAAVAAFLRSVQSFHMDGPYLSPRGGSDIAYSFAIDVTGTIWELRGWGVAGGHTMGANSTCHGVLLILGPDQNPTSKMIAAIRDLNAEHTQRWGPGWLRGHCEVAGNPSGTVCPGPHVLRLLRSDLANTPPPSPTPPAPSEEDEIMSAVDHLVAHMNVVGDSVVKRLKETIVAEDADEDMLLGGLTKYLFPDGVNEPGRLDVLEAKLDKLIQLLEK